MRCVTWLGVLLVPAIAAADPALELGARSPNGVVLARYQLPANGATGLAQSRIIYLNHKGVTLTPGTDDSNAQTSSIISQRVSVPAWNPSNAATWPAVVACMQDEYARFDVTVTDQDPGNVPHIEAMFGGSPQDIGMPSGVGGVSPFTSDCGIIEGSIVFTFTDVFPEDPQLICEVMAQETAHSYGLDHEMLASDPMTYLQYSGHKTFQDMTASCGEYQNRTCGINGSNCRPDQNSVQLLTARVGTSDNTPPVVGITAPADGARVAPGFEVDATATDHVAVSKVTLAIDGAVVATLPAGPYTFRTDASLADGPHQLVVEALDPRGNKADQMIMVTVARDGGSGGGSGGGGEGTGGTTGDGGQVHGGCAAGSGSGALAALALAGLRRRRRSHSAVLGCARSN